MEHLYAPWRETYFKNKPDGCVFCHISTSPEEDKKLGVLYRDAHCFVVMNRFPYTPGHIMVIPHQHTDRLEALSAEVWQHMAVRVQQGAALLKTVLHAPALNLGMNIGAEAGAGIAEHLHYHILPRWFRDTNFITTIGGARVYSNDFEALYEKLLEHAPEFFGATV